MSYEACYKVKNKTTIGYGSCNADNVCTHCAEYSIIPDNACDDRDGVDCTVCSMKNNYKCRFGFWRRPVCCCYQF